MGSAASMLACSHPTCSRARVNIRDQIQPQKLRFTFFGDATLLFLVKITWEEGSYKRKNNTNRNRNQGRGTKRGLPRRLLILLLLSHRHAQLRCSYGIQCISVVMIVSNMFKSKSRYKALDPATKNCVLHFLAILHCFFQYKLHRKRTQTKERRKTTEIKTEERK